MQADKCPRCGCEGNDPYDFYLDEYYKGKLYAYCECEDCGTRWVDVFTLTEKAEDEE